MRVMFMWPGATLPGFASLKEGNSNEATYINHGLALISSILKGRGHICQLLDLRGFFGWRHFENAVKDIEFDVAVIGFMSCDAEYAAKMCEITKKHHPGKPIYGGGVHLSVTRATSFPGIDCIVWGEGEITLPELIEEGKVPDVIQGEPVLNLDTLPHTDRNLFNTHMEEETPLLPALPKPFVTTVFGRGCPYKCTFCAPSRELIFGKKRRIRSVGHIIEELCSIRAGSGIGSIMIHDDLIAGKKWVEEFIESFGHTMGYIPFWCQMRADFIVKYPELIKGLAEVGLTWVSIGLESGSDRILKFLKKGTSRDMNIAACDILRENSVNIFANYIFGLPTETEEDINATIEMLKLIRPEWHSASIYTSYPGSYLYEYIKRNDLWLDEHYSKIRYPYERKIKGVDYELVFRKISEATSLREPVRERKRPIRVFQTQPSPPIPKLDIHAVSRGEIKCSIIMASYNRPRFLYEAIRSVEEQTDPRWELIIVDDCSTNKENKKIMEDAKRRNPGKVRILYNTRNVNNIAYSWNRAIDVARGEYIAFLDNDNRKLPDFVRKLAYILDHNQAYVAACGFNVVIDGCGKRMSQSPHTAPLEATYERLLEKNYIDSGEVMVRRSVFDTVGYFDERCVTGEDWDMMIRIFQLGEVYVLPEPVAEYRWHAENRMYSSEALGYFNRHRPLIQSKVRKLDLSVYFIWPGKNRLTESQTNVCTSIIDALEEIPWVSLRVDPIQDISPPGKGVDLAFVACPFEIPLDVMEIIASWGLPVLNFHTEDPNALDANLERARFASWISTNDTSTLPYYKEVVGERVVYCPSLSVNPKRHKIINPKPDPVWDVVICGHPYASRIRFIQSIKDLVDFRVLLIGNHWSEWELPACFETKPTLSEDKTFELYQKAKIIVALNRQKTDCGGREDQLRPVNAMRGYIEAYSGTLLMIDDSRQIIPPFAEGEVVTFNRKDPEGFIEKVNYYLKHESKRAEIARKAQARAKEHFTFKSRLIKLLNCFRSERYGMLIP